MSSRALIGTTKRLEQGATIDLKHEGQVIQPLEQHATSTVLELDQLIAAEARLKRQRLLCQAPLEAQPADVGTDPSTRLSPAFLLLRIHLISSCRHALMSRELCMNVCHTNSA